jgi:multiple sugar transport system permease protein
LISRPLRYAMVAPVQTLLLVFIFVPSLYVGWLSLHASSFGTEATWVGWSNYVTLLTDGQFWRAFLNTFVLVNVVVYVELALGLAMALLFVGGMPFPKVTLAIVLAPYAISEVVAVIMWKYMFEPQVGPLQWALRSIGLPEIDWAVNPVHALGLVALLAVWHHLPFTFLLLYAALLGVPKELYEAARVDGAGPWTIFRRITLPVIMPAVLVALLFRYIFAFRIFSEPWLLTQGGPARSTEVLAVYLYKAAFRYHDFGVAAATGWAMVVLSLLISLPYLRVMYRRMFIDAA